MRHSNNYNRQGFTLLEIMMTITVLAIVIIPMMNALSSAYFSVETQEKTIVFLNRARGTLNRIACLDFDKIDPHKSDPAPANPTAVDLKALLDGDTNCGESCPESAKETFSFNGISYTPTVYILKYDADGDGTIVGDETDDYGLLEIKVTIEHVTLNMLRAIH
ncbi:MAG: prepilin-type N-terminal cleavage/methylation domain-containing protein [Pseudomonadota bacterium]